MRFYLDEDLSPKIAEALRRAGVDALSAHDAGNLGIPDTEQIAFAARENRCLVTRNREDFVELSHRAIQQGEPHAGIVLVSSRFTGQEVGAIVRGVTRIARQYPRGLGSYDVLYLQ